jgi:regulator of sigma E protease
MDTLLGIILVLGVMILVHEWGHFVVARLCGVRVDVFSIGFGPKLFGWKSGPTEYRLSALPLGGYVRMAGQDLSEIDSGQQAPTGAPDELMSKPRWQRALIILAGPTVNLLMPILLIGGFYILRGMPYPSFLDKPPVIAGIAANDPLKSDGVVPGDRITSVNGVPTPSWDAVDDQFSAASQSDSMTLSIEHQGAVQQFTVNTKAILNAEAPVRYQPIRTVIGQVSKGYPAYLAGIRRGDEIVSVNGTSVANWPEFVDMVEDSGGKNLNVGVKRGEKVLTLSLQPRAVTGDNGKQVYRIGVAREEHWAYKPMSLTSAFANAASGTWSVTQQLFGVVGKLFTGKMSISQLQGPVGIADLAGQAVQEGTYAVINLMAVISLNLGVLNLLPIPILDGGHILLLSIEGIRRRDLSLTFKERFIQVGFVFLLVLFSIVMYHDVVRLLPIRS